MRSRVQWTLLQSGALGQGLQKMLRSLSTLRLDIEAPQQHGDALSIIELVDGNQCAACTTDSVRRAPLKAHDVEYIESGLTCNCLM